MEKQIDDILASMEIAQEFKQWGLEILKDNFENEMQIKEDIVAKLQSSLDSAEKKLKNLTNALIGELIDEEEFSVSKKQLKIDIKLYREKVAKLNDEKDISIDVTKEVFDFIILARSSFNH